MQYTYHLARWSERDKTLLCPGCGRKLCFKEYVDEEGRAVDETNHLCGKCDHEWCGYHVTPKEWQKQHPEAERRVAEYKQRPQLKRIEIPRQHVAATMKAYDQNIFVKWLYSLPWENEVRDAISKALFLYAVGTTKDGGTIWWQVDEQGIIRTGKKILYMENGHRAKDAEGNSIGFNWIHAILRKQGMFPEREYDLVQCLFGQHLLQNATPDTVIHIVESEKTAFLMALFDPKFGQGNLWMACGGLYNLNAQRLLPLKGHKIIVYPDTNGVERWAKQIEGIPDCELATGWIKNVTTEDPQGADIADICLRRLMMTPEVKRDELIKDYPTTKILIDKLKLEPIR